MSCASCKSDACSCVSNFKEAVFPSRVAWSTGAAQPGASVIVLPDIGISDVAPTIDQMQATITVSECSAAFRCKVGYQVSSDGTTWDSVVYFGAPDTQVGNGSLTTAWNPAGINYKRKIRFVLSAEQDTGSAVLAVAHVAITIGFRVK